MHPALRLLVSLFLPLAIGALGGFLTSSNISTWYATLDKPAFNPPNWIFGPVWTLLYLLMGLSLYLLWSSRPSKARRHALFIFMVQIVLNLCWSYLFFYLRQPPLALVDIVVLWLAIVITILKFRRISRPAAHLLLPYLLWVSFATYLNYEIVRLN